MSRRIDVELTSSRDDGTWTWRAAGAKQPKGVVDAGVLPPAAKVGDVLKVDAEFDIEGITILAVVTSKAKEKSEPKRIEILGSGKAEPGVITSLVPKGERPRRDRDRDRDRPRDGDRSGGPRPRPTGGPRSERGSPGGERGTTERGRGPRPERDRNDRTGAPAGDRRPPRTDRPDRARPDRPGRPDRAAASTEAPDRPKAKRLSPANVHRKVLLESLPDEQRPVAEQVLRGGLPAVRQALETQNTAAREEGGVELPTAPIIAIAEQLLPALKLAEWRDRAEAAAADVDELALRDLRSVVAGSEAVARDDETRALAQTLREALTRRLGQQRDEWIAGIGSALEENRLVRALRIASRAPDPGTRLPADLAVKLAEAAERGARA